MNYEASIAVAATALHVIVVAAVILRVIWVRRPAGSAYAWMLLVTVLPLVGLVLYLLVGERPIGRERLRRAQAFYAGFPAIATPLWARDVADAALLSPPQRGLSRLALRAAGLPVQSALRGTP